MAVYRDAGVRIDSGVDEADELRRTEYETCFEKASRFETAGTTGERSRNPLQGAAAMNLNGDINPDILSQFRLSWFSRFRIPTKCRDSDIGYFPLNPILPFWQDTWYGSRHFSRQTVANGNPLPTRILPFILPIRQLSATRTWIRTSCPHSKTSLKRLRHKSGQDIAIRDFSSLRICHLNTG